MKYIRSPVYHPCANGLLERFHWSLKTSLATRNDTTNKVDDFPLIMISLRKTIKEDLGYSAAATVFGTPLSLPKQYFSLSTESTPPTNYAQELRNKMPQMAYTPPQHGSTHAYVPHHLKECEFIFVRNDAVKRPLTPTNTGPLKLPNCADKHIMIECSNNNSTVSIDRIKIAFYWESRSYNQCSIRRISRFL